MIANGASAARFFPGLRVGRGEQSGGTISSTVHARVMDGLHHVRGGADSNGDVLDDAGGALLP